MRRAKGPGIRFRDLGSASSTYKSAIVIIPPQNCWKDIQDIRVEHDKAYERWMPHINLIYPFLEDTTSGGGGGGGHQGVFHTETQKLVKHLGAIKPFKVAFTKDSVGQFVHGRTATIWLKPLRPSGGDDDDNQVTRNTIQKSAKQKKSKPVKKTISPVVPRPVQSVTHVPQVSTAGVVEVTGYPPPISGCMRYYESSLDRLKNAEWTPESSNRTPLKEIMQLGPGLDCLRYAEWTPGINKPMFTETVHKTQMQISQGTAPVERNQPFQMHSVAQDEEMTESEEEFSSDDGEEFQVVGKRENCTNTNPTASHPGVLELQAKLQDMYPALNDLSTRSPDGFQPHLTLGQDTRGRLLEDVKQRWRPLEFTVTHVHLISRPDDRTPFKIKQSVPLGAFDEM